VHDRRDDVVLAPSFFYRFTIRFFKELFGKLVVAALVKICCVDVIDELAKKFGIGLCRRYVLGAEVEPPCSILRRSFRTFWLLPFHRPVLLYYSI